MMGICRGTTSPKSVDFKTEIVRGDPSKRKVFLWLQEGEVWPGLEKQSPRLAGEGQPASASQSSQDENRTSILPGKALSWSTHNLHEPGSTNRSPADQQQTLIGPQIPCTKNPGSLSRFLPYKTMRLINVFGFKPHFQESVIQQQIPTSHILCSLFSF